MVRQTVLAGVCHLIVGVGAGVAGIFDDVDQRRLIILFPNGRFVHAVGQQTLL